MTVWIDQANIQYRRMKMCHMISDDLDELHQMATAIGMLRSWFQPFSFPHYDVSKARRIEAVRLGAIEIDRREIVEIMRRLRVDEDFVVQWRENVKKGVDSSGRFRLIPGVTVNSKGERL